MRTTIRTLSSFTLAATLALAGCAEDNDAPDGLRAANAMGGATVIFDLDARPLPEIPFPNDVATRVDPDSPTGKRVNVSTIAPTQLETRVRENANKLDGFATYGPIYVSFDEPLDVKNILDRHTEPTPDITDDAVYLVNVDPDSEEYGKFEMLDLGRGNFPVTMKSPDKYFDFDPRAHGTNLLFESVEEVDENGNGILDPVEDTDDDGVWDQPNTLTPGADPLAKGQMLDFYERETNTLVLRVLDALEPGTKYAVVLTRALVDADGIPIDSPFPYVNHARQTEDLKPLRELLPKALPERFDHRLEEVRFAWTFTTQTTTLELEQIRAGMYGHGNFSWLSREFPAEMKLVHQIQSDGADSEVMLARVDRLVPILVQALAADSPPEASQAIVDAAKDIDYVVAGSFLSPYFLFDKDGLHGDGEDLANNENTFDENESFNLDLNTGQADVGPDEVTWMCMVPKAKPGRQPPFPVVIYGHGYGGARLEALGFAPTMAKFGLTTCAIDNVGHGLPVERFIPYLPIDVAPLVENIGLGNLINSLGHGRQRDLTNDGLDDPGGDYWTADTFHTRDMVRQTTIDYMQFIRIMRTWNGDKKWPDALPPEGEDPYVDARRHFVAGWDTDLDGESEIAGDFNGDGQVDFGGEQPYYAWGQSLGGIQSAVLGSIDPAVRATAPTAGGAGLGDIAIRSTQGGVPEAVLLRMMGPVVLGRPIERWNDETQQFEWTGSSRLEFLIPDAFEEIYLPFATVDGLETGDRVVVRNLTREERPELVEPGTLTSRATVRDGIFRTGIAADAVGTNERRLELGLDTSFDVIDLHRRDRPVEDGLQQDWYLRRGQNGGVVTSELADNIDFSWGEGEAPDGMRPSEHSILWRGVMKAPSSELYEIRAEVEGRVEVFLDGREIIDVTNDELVAKITLEEGTWYDFRVEYDRRASTGSVRLYWSTETRDEEIIPASAFQSHVPLSDPEKAELARHQIADATEWGDPFVVEIWGADGKRKRTIDTFEQDVYYQNVLYAEGTPLAALTEGWGLKRQTPQLRRFFSIAQMILEKADPANYAEQYFEKPLQFDYETPQFQDGTSNVLVVPTTGDSAVPVNTGLSIARIAGVVDYRETDPRYGMTQNQFLVDNWVYEGIYWLDRFGQYPGALFDVDDLDRGTFESSRYPERGTDPNPDAEEPLRAKVGTSKGISAMRIPYTQVVGEHGFALPNPTNAFDIDAFMANQIGYYFANGSEKLSDDPCMQELSMEGCDFFDAEDWQRPDVQ
jgi:hypothetical protein